MRYLIATIACFLTLLVCTSVLRKLIVPFSFETPGFLMGSIITGVLVTMVWRLIAPSRKKAANKTAPNPDKLMASDMPPARVEDGLIAMTDDAFYDEVAKEMQENRLIPGVWTRAFAEADGDENRAKAVYIKLRVAQLMDDRVRDVQEERQKLKKDRGQRLRNGFERAMFGFLGFASAVLGGIFAAGILGLIIYVIYSKEYRDLLSLGWFVMAFVYITLAAGFFVGARRCFKLSKAKTLPKLSEAESCPKRKPLFR